MKEPYRESVKGPMKIPSRDFVDAPLTTAKKGPLKGFIMGPMKIAFKDPIKTHFEKYNETPLRSPKKFLRTNK